MKTSQQRTGAWAEQYAYDFLRAAGLSCRTRNYRAPCGEIDLIMEDRDTLVFVEVRYRASHGYGGAIESIDRRKQVKLVNTAQHYLQRSGSPRQCRFDAVLISGSRQTPDVEWIRDAFGG